MSHRALQTQHCCQSSAGIAAKAHAAQHIFCGKNTIFITPTTHLSQVASTRSSFCKNAATSASLSCLNSTSCGRTLQTDAASTQNTTHLNAAQHLLEHKLNTPPCWTLYSRRIPHFCLSLTCRMLQAPAPASAPARPPQRPFLASTPPAAAAARSQHEPALL